jgi:CRP/FNR family cyclic AMP-dependent transcriptional regulator
MTDSENVSLKSISLLADLPEKALIDLAKRCIWRNFAPGEQLINRQSDSCDLYFIVKGRSQVVNFSLSGREVTFDDREGGEYFGELAALDGKPRSANVVALENMIVACLSQEGFHDMLLTYPQVAVRILKDMAKIIRISTDRIMDLSTLGANNRVHAELLRLASRNIEDDNTARLSPIPIHGDIASRVSTTRETVARVFSDLTREGILKRDQNALIILNVKQLNYIVAQVRGEGD